MAKASGITFNYIARNKKTGAIIEGAIKASSQDKVEEHLVRAGHTPISVTPATGTGLNREISLGNLGKKRIKPRDVAIWLRQFSTMITSIDQLSSLNTLAKQTSNEKLREVTEDIKNVVEGGGSLSSAMEEHPTVFTHVQVRMVAAAEQGGFLPGTLRQISADLDADIALRAKIKSALTYPLVVLAMTVLIVTGMLIFIVPTFEDMFASLGGQLPTLTQLLVTLSDFIKVAGLPILAGIIVFAVWWSKNKNLPAIRKVLDPLKLSMPIFGKLFSMVALARFSRNFSTLLKSGVPIMESLDIVGGTSGNIIIEDALQSIREGVKKGQSMSANMAQHDVFPPMVTTMVSVGEDSGRVEEMLDKISEDYTEQVDTTTAQLASLIEPLMIVFLGVVVGGMVIALYLPIFSVYEMISG